MVCGQRQVGKSTMLNHIKETCRRYVTLDDGNARRLAIQDPALFLKFMDLCFADRRDSARSFASSGNEKIVDQKKLAGEANNGMFWIIGSQKFKMMQEVSESLAGYARYLIWLVCPPLKLRVVPPGFFSLI